FLTPAAGHRRRLDDLGDPAAGAQTDDPAQTRRGSGLTHDHGDRDQGPAGTQLQAGTALGARARTQGYFRMSRHIFRKNTEGVKRPQPLSFVRGGTSAARKFGKSAFTGRLRAFQAPARWHGELIATIRTRSRMATEDRPHYDAGDLTVPDGLDAGRERSGMDIGSTSERGLHHLGQEIVDNSVDEAMAGYCDHIQVTLLADGGVQVSDDGRGMPVAMHPTENKPTVEVILTILHAGGK